MSSFSDFVYIFTRITSLWKVFGFYPYVRSNSDIKFSPRWLSVTIIIFILLIIAESYIIFYYKLDTLIHTFFFCYFVFLTILLVYCYVNLRINCTILNLIIENLERIHISLSNYNFLSREKVVSFRSFSTVLYVIFILLYSISREPDLKMNLYHASTFYVLTVWQVCTMQIVDMLYLIDFYFRYLRYAIESLEKRLFYKIEQLYILVENFNLLCTTSINFEEHFGFQCLLIVTALFLSFIINIYAFLGDLISERSAIRLDFIFIRLLWSWHILANLLQLVNPCVSISEESRKFNTFLYQMMIDDKSNYISNNERLRLHISMKREVVFTAYGFFPLDYTLIHSILAAGTTYLVILVQFGQNFISVPVSSAEGSTSQTTTVTQLPNTLTSPL